MRKQSRTRYAVLGMLSLGDMSGYQIKKHIAESIAHFWSESYGQLYPELARMTKEGLTSVKPERGKAGRSRKTYSLTRKGAGELRTWLQAPVREEPPRSELLLKLFFGNSAPSDANIGNVTEFRDRHMQLLKVYDGITRHLQAKCANDPNLPFWLITLNFGRHRSQALLKWADETIKVLESEKGHQVGKERTLRQLKS